MEVKILNKEQLQELLNISDKQVAALFNVPDFPHTRIGTKRYVIFDDLVEWLRNHKGSENGIKLDYYRV